MYRSLVLVLLSINAGLGAPQDRESSITYLKIQPQAADKPVEDNYRSYRIIPSNKTTKKFNKNVSIPVLLEKNENDSSIPPEVDVKYKPTNLSENNSKESDDVKEILLENSTINLSKNNVTVNTTEESVVDTKVSEVSPVKEDKTESDPVIEETKDHKNIYKDTFENLDTDPSETSQFDRHSRDNDFTTSAYDSGEAEVSDYSTEKYEDPEDAKSLAKKEPKLTYFQKFGGSFSNNLIDTSGKRRFRSRCRCEKIWNCPKLQITVPRCPEEYFMCCF